QQFETLCELIGRPELMRDPRFAKRGDRLKHRFELNAEIERALVTRPASEWSTLMNERGVPAGEVLDVPSILKHPQIVERQLLRTFDEVPDVDAAVSVVRSGFRLASGDPAPASPPPALGADTAALLNDLGYSQSEIDG